MKLHNEIMKHLRSTVVGNIEGIEDVASALVLHHANLGPVDKPIGSFMLSGPTGVGKTWLVESLAKYIHGSERALLRIDCGSYTAEHEVAKLLGAPPGYLGHKESPPLLCQKFVTDVGGNVGISIILFDEIDKAAKSIHKTLLSVLDKAELRLGDNSLTRFNKSMLFFTSNHGQDKVQAMLSHGFGFIKPEGDLATKSISVTKRETHRDLTPEFINRVDYWITFSPLTKKDTEAIIELEIAKTNAFLRAKLGPLSNIKVNVSKAGKEWLLENGYSQQYGCRPLKKVIKKHILEQIAAYILSEEDKSKLINGPTTYFDVGPNGLEMRLKKLKLAVPA